MQLERASKPYLMLAMPLPGPFVDNAASVSDVRTTDPGRPSAPSTGVSPTGRYRGGGMTAETRVAYLIVSDVAPDQLSRLTAVLRAGSPGAAIAVQHDDADGALDLRRLHELDVDLLETSSVPRGSAAELMMLLRCLRRMRQSVRFDWLTLISGRHYPVRPVAEIEATLAGADTDGFIDTHPCAPPVIRRTQPIDEYATRYHYRWSPMPGPVAPLARAVATAAGPHVLVRSTAAGDRIGVPAKRSPFRAPKRRPLPLPVKRNPLSSVQAERSPFGEGLECRYGSRWWVLSRRAVEVVDAAVREHPELVLYFRDTLVPAESYIQTVLANDRTITVRNECRHRELSGADDVDALAGVDFAGPFDADAPLLDAIDVRVHRA